MVGPGEICGGSISVPGQHTLWGLTAVSSQSWQDFPKKCSVFSIVHLRCIPAGIYTLPPKLLRKDVDYAWKKDVLTWLHPISISALSKTRQYYLFYQRVSIHVRNL